MMKKIAILGAAESGTGAAILAKKEGYDVFVSDMSPIKERYKKMLDDRQIQKHARDGDHSIFAPCALCEAGGRGTCTAWYHCGIERP